MEQLTACYERTFDLSDLLISKAETLAERSGDVLVIIVHFHCQANAGLNPPLVPQRPLSSLPEQYSNRILAISERLYELQNTGVKEKSVKIESRAVIDLSLGASTWVHNWLQENQSISVSSLTNEVCSIFSGAILAEPKEP